MGDSTYKTFQSVLSANTRYLKRWLGILCDTEEHHNMFFNSFLDITDLESSMYEFKAYLKFAGRGQEIKAGHIKDCIGRQDRIQLKNMLEELLLIPVDDTEAAKVLRIQDYSKLEDLIEKVKMYSNTRYKRVIDEYFNYS